MHACRAGTGRWLWQRPRQGQRHPDDEPRWRGQPRTPHATGAHKGASKLDGEHGAGVETFVSHAAGGDAMCTCQACCSLNPKPWRAALWRVCQLHGHPWHAAPRLVCQLPGWAWRH
eukprot:366237-Chlamydomonas_euryale.AAC.2